MFCQSAKFSLSVLFVFSSWLSASSSLRPPSVLLPPNSCSTLSTRTSSNLSRANKARALDVFSKKRHQNSCRRRRRRSSCICDVSPSSFFFVPCTRFLLKWRRSRGPHRTRSYATGTPGRSWNWSLGKKERRERLERVERERAWRKRSRCCCCKEAHRARRKGKKGQKNRSLLPLLAPRLLSCFSFSLERRVPSTLSPPEETTDRIRSIFEREIASCFFLLEIEKTLTTNKKKPLPRPFFF